MSGPVDIMPSPVSSPGASPVSSPKEGGYFPASLEKQFSNVRLEESSIRDGRTYRILVAEDNAVSLKLLERLVIEKSSHHIDVAKNGQIAVDMAGRVKYDLIFMDHSMPVKNGVEATREIRTNTCNATTPIVVQSDQPLSFLKREFAQLFIADYVKGREEGKGGKLTKVDQLNEVIARLQQEGRL